MKRTFKAVAVPSIFVIFAGVSVYAMDSFWVTAKVPFGFTAGNESLPAGDYIFTTDDQENPTLLTIQSKDGKKHEFILTDSHGLSQTADESKVVFERTGNKNYLSQVCVAGMDVVEVVPQSRIEKEMAREARMRKTIEIPAHR